MFVPSQTSDFLCLSQADKYDYMKTMATVGNAFSKKLITITSLILT